MTTTTATAAEGHDDPSQWTRIGRKGKKLGRKQQQPAPPRSQPQPSPPAAGPAENFQPNPSPQLSADDIRAAHDKIAARWRASDARDKLHRLVESHAASHRAVRRAVCLGLGAFDPDDGSWLAQRRSHIQLAAFLTMVETLEAQSGTKIECFYQEPRFAQPDKDFITSLGGKVVESPESYELVGPETLVFGIHLYRDIWAAALDRSLPGIFVGTGWDVWDETQGAHKHPDFDRIREMDATFDRFPFPQDDHSSFSSTCVYWKKVDVDETLASTIDRLKLSGTPNDSKADEDEKGTDASP